jgi:hypothetical protein
MERIDKTKRETKVSSEQTLEEIVDGFIDSNPIIYERLSKL